MSMTADEALDIIRANAREENVPLNMRSADDPAEAVERTELAFAVLAEVEAKATLHREEGARLLRADPVDGWRNFSMRCAKVLDAILTRAASTQTEGESEPDADDR